MAVIVHPGKGTFASETLTVSSTAKVLTSTKYVTTSATEPNKVARGAIITVLADAIRYFCDGSVPDANTGHKVAAGDTIVLSNFDDIRNFQAIRVTTDATITVSYVL